jgi:hypothetical protein
MVKGAFRALAVVVVLAGCTRAADTLAGVMEPYLRIQAALSTDSIIGVPADAAGIAGAAASLGDRGKQLQTAAKELQAAGDLRAARAAFGKLSDALVAYAAATDSALGPGVKVAYCPMVQKSWAQKGDTIANPYYGKEMLTCGAFRK